MMNVEAIEQVICSSLCADVKITSQGEGLLHVSTPFTFPDGDSYSIYLQPLDAGGFRVTDLGGTLMHLSYENEISKFREGTRGRVFAQILAELDLADDNGEFFIDTSADRLGASIFKFGQALTRIHDLTFLNRVRVESTFYEDLRQKLAERIDSTRIVEGYTVPGLANADDYPIDFCITGARQPLYLFGVPTADKARLATIILQHLNLSNLEFHSMIVFQNSTDIPVKDLSRLMNAANDMISSLDATDTLDRKLRLAV